MVLVSRQDAAISEECAQSPVKSSKPSLQALHGLYQRSEMMQSQLLQILHQHNLDIQNREGFKDIEKKFMEVFMDGWVIYRGGWIQNGYYFLESFLKPSHIY